jgi:hypothetical protein
LTANPSSALVDGAKNIGAVLTTASALAYASGYLALRARAYALGTDPGFTLVDQAYIFAGFRFVLNTLVALLVIAPLLILIRAAVRWLPVSPQSGRGRILAWVAAIVLALLTLGSFATLDVRAVLVGGTAPDSSIQRALTWSILGIGNLGVLITLGATLTTTLSVLWTRACYVAVGITDPLAVLLTIIAVLQLILLPIQHGIFFADRSARTLARVPEGVSGVSPPIWLLDRGSNRASLVARGADGRLSLITVKVDALDGIPVTETVPISKIVFRTSAP